MPSVGVVAFAYGFRERDFGVSVDGDVIVVIKINDVAEPEVACNRRSLARHTFHVVAVATYPEDARLKKIGVAAREARLHMLGGNRHADSIANALAERPGRRLDTGGMVDLRMAGSLAAQLPELLDIIE